MAIPTGTAGRHVSTAPGLGSLEAVGDPADRDHDGLDLRRAPELVADRGHGDLGGGLEGEPADAVPRPGIASVVTSCSRARAKVLRMAASTLAAFVRRSRSRDTAWMTSRAASRPAAVTTASPTETGS